MVFTQGKNINLGDFQIHRFYCCCTCNSIRRNTWVGKCSDLMLTLMNAFSIFISNRDVMYLSDIKSYVFIQVACASVWVACVSIQAPYICPSAIYICLSTIYICLSAIYICPSASECQQLHHSLYFV